MSFNFFSYTLRFFIFHIFWVCHMRLAFLSLNASLSFSISFLYFSAYIEARLSVYIIISASSDATKDAVQITSSSALVEDGHSLSLQLNLAFSSSFSFPYFAIAPILPPFVFFGVLLLHIVIHL